MKNSLRLILACACLLAAQAIMVLERAPRRDRESSWRRLVTLWRKGRWI